MTRSTPSISSSGNMSPASTMMRSSPSSKTIMFLPISPSPPRGITRSLSAICSEEPHLLRFRLLGNLYRGRLASQFHDRGYIPEVFFDPFTHAAGVEGRRRVVHGNEVGAVFHLGLAVHLADCVPRREPGQGVAAQADDDLRSDDLDLLLQVLAAGGGFAREGGGGVGGGGRAGGGG